MPLTVMPVPLERLPPQRFILPSVFFKRKTLPRQNGPGAPSQGSWRSPRQHRPMCRTALDFPPASAQLGLHFPAEADSNHTPGQFLKENEGRAPGPHEARKRLSTKAVPSRDPSRTAPDPSHRPAERSPGLGVQRGQHTPLGRTGVAQPRRTPISLCVHRPVGLGSHGRQPLGEAGLSSRS